jgi:hypothetical protein
VLFGPAMLATFRVGRLGTKAAVAVIAVIGTLRRERRRHRQAGEQQDGQEGVQQGGLLVRVGREQGLVAATACGVFCVAERSLLFVLFGPAMLATFRVAAARRGTA